MSLKTPSVITSNLLSFYQTFSQFHEEINDQSDERAYHISSKSHSWPNLVFLDPETEVEALKTLSYLQKKDCPKNLITPKSSKALPTLNRYGFRIFGQWYGMTLDRGMSIAQSKPKFPVEIKQVVRESEMLHFVNIINECIFHSNLLSPDLLLPTLIKGTGFKYYIAYADNKAIAAVLTYENEQSVGLYWMAVKPSFRRKGIGLYLGTSVLRAYCDKIKVLQATKSGRKLYLNMGFEEKMCYYLFKKIK